MADDDYSDFEPANPEADVAEVEGSDYSGFIPEASSQSGAIRMASEWVPGERTTHDTQYGPDGKHLVFGASAAVSPNLAQGHQLHEPFEVYRNGKSIGRYNYDDASYYSPGHPTTNTVERYGLPDMGRADSIKWLGSGGAKDDYSGFIAENQQPSGQDDYSGFVPEEQQEPESENQKAIDLMNRAKTAQQQQPKQEYAGVPKDQVQTAGENPWDVGKFLQTFVGSGVQQLLTNEKGAAEAQQHPETRQVLPYEEQVQQAKENAILNNPDTSQEEADDIIHQRNQRLAYTKANAQQNLQEATGALSEAQKNVDQRYEATPAGQAAKTLGTGAASLIPALTGPAAPLTLAEQMGASTYAEEKDRATASAKKAHPEWTDEQIDAASTQAAENASRTSAESGVILSLLPVPKIGPLLARVIERMGMRGAYMAIAGAAQDISANKELQNIDPNQALYEGVLAHLPANFAAGAAFELPGAIGEAIGRPKAAPQETPESQQRAETPAEPQKAAPVEENGETGEESPAESQPEGPERIRAAAVQYIPTGKVVEGYTHYDAAIAAERNKDPNNWNVGFTTNRGRFVDRDEAYEIAQNAKQTSQTEEPKLAAEDLGRNRSSGEPEPEAESELEEMYSGISPKAILKAAEPLEHLYLPNREVVAKQPHTEELINALDEFRALEGELHGRVAELSNLFKTLKRQNPNLDKEIDQIGRYAEKNRALPAKMSPEATQWLQAANNGLYRQIGDRMRAGGFKVVNPDGSTRPFIGAPPDVTPLPRVMRPDVERTLQGPLLDKSGNFTPDAAKLYQEGVNAGYFQKPEDLTAWARQYRMDHSEKPNITNLERARTSKYPSFFYTYSPQAMLDRLFWQSTELARLESFGQKLPGQSDLFDKTADKLNADMTLGNDRKQPAFNAIEALRRTVYGQNKRSWGIRLLRGASSAGLAGSPHTSAKIGLSMLFNIPQYRGIGRTLSGIFGAAVHPTQTYAELRRLGLSQATLINIHDDPYSVATAERRASNIFTGILKLAGHSLVQDVGKAVTMRVSKSWIERASQILQRDPQLKTSLARQVAQDIQRRGIDPALFASGNVSQALKDRFVREDVNDLQTAYRPEDYPAWQASGMGSVMFQFGHWAYNGARAITREAVAPMVRAYGQGDYMLAARYFGRLAGLSLAAGGAAEAWRQLDQLFGRQPAVATIGEIMKAFTRNNPESAHMLTARLMEDILTSPVLGTFGDIANLGRNVTKGAAGETHFFNPASPAAVGYLSIVANAVNMAFQQGGHLSMRQIANISSQLAALGKGYYDIANSLGAATSQVTGAKANQIPIPGHAEAMGRRENTFVKSRLDVFYEMHPELDKRQKGGTFAGNTHTPYLQDLNEELLAGNNMEARRIATAMKKDLGLTDKQWQTSLRESINAHRPIPTGTAGDAFMRWAPRSLTPDELQRMRRIERIYESTAQRAGLPVKEAE